MEKLLHERLREHSQTPGLTMKANGCEVRLFNSEARNLADEIERYYIPRPRFEDGEPAGVGKEAEFVKLDGGTITGVITGVKVMSDGYAVSADYEDGFEHVFPYADFEPIKRPTPKVYDADEVPCKRGDKGWCRNNGEPCEIVNVSANGVLDIKWLDSSGLTTRLAACCFTHHEPDSLEKLRDDMKRDNIDPVPMEIGQWIDRLTALIERGA